MANKKHVEILRQGVAAWNDWRKNNPKVKPDLSGMALKRDGIERIDLSGANFSKTNLMRVELREANLTRIDFSGADLRAAKLDGSGFDRSNLRGANLRRAELRVASLDSADLAGADLSHAHLLEAKACMANFEGAKLVHTSFWGATVMGTWFINADLSKSACREANFRRAILTGVKLVEADLSYIDLTEANLAGANLKGAWLHHAQLGKANLTDANLTGCHIFGVSAWDLRLDGANQNSLIITSKNEPVITVDNLEVAQFIYLLLNNQKVRSVIDTITTKVVLILGRFTPERKAILDLIREELRRHDYLPILFDFDKPTKRDITETVSTLAHLARFIIADISDAKSIPQELQRIIPQLPSVPVQPIICEVDLITTPPPSELTDNIRLLLERCSRSNANILYMCHIFIPLLPRSSLDITLMPSMYFKA